MSAPQQMLFGSGGGFPVAAVDFDGANDYMTRGANLSSIADSSTGIVSVWFRLDGSDGTTRRIIALAPNTALFALLVRGDNLLQFTLINSTAAPTSTVDLRSLATFLAGSGWHHLFVSWNVNAIAGSRTFNWYIDGVAPGFTTSADTGIAFSVPWTTATDWFIGAFNTGAQMFDGCLAELYFAPGQYLADPTAFISGGKPKDLGATGATPTGAAPSIYQRVAANTGVASDFATNLGTGGNFTITGTLDLCSTTPSG